MQVGSRHAREAAAVADAHADAGQRVEAGLEQLVAAVEGREEVAARDRFVTVFDVGGVTCPLQRAQVRRVVRGRSPESSERQQQQETREGEAFDFHCSAPIRPAETGFAPATPGVVVGGDERSPCVLSPCAGRRSWSL